MANISVESLTKANKVLDAVLSTTVVYGTNTGNGTVSGVIAPISTITEDWALTCTAVAVDSGTFSVVGSISGVQADATVGVTYDNSIVAFTINDGLTDWAIGDTITISIVRDITVAKTVALNTLQIDITGDITAVGFDIKSSLTGDKLYINSSETLTAGDITNLGKLYTPVITKAHLHVLELTSVAYTTSATITAYSM